MKPRPWAWKRMFGPVMLLGLLLTVVACKPKIDQIAPLEPEDTSALPAATTDTSSAAKPTTSKPVEDEPTSPAESSPVPTESSPATPSDEQPRGFAITTQECLVLLEDRGLAFETWGFSRGYPRHFGSSEDYVTVAQVVGTPDALLSASLVTSVQPENPQDFIQKSQYLYVILEQLLPTWEEGGAWLSEQIKAGLAAPVDQPYSAVTAQDGVNIKLTVSRWTEALGLELMLEGPDPGLPIGDDLTLRYETYAELDTALNLDIRHYTPYLEGELTEQVAAFNAAVTALVEDQVAGVRDLLGGAAVPDPGGTIQIDYQVTYASSALLSLLFDIGTYTGGAHPNSYAMVLNYDLQAGKVLSPDDVFTSGYLDVLAAYCRKDLADRERLEFPEGADPTPENYRNWSITADGILITFDAYQVGPYAMGPQTVVVPYAELADFLLTGGPLSSVLQ